MNRTLHHIQQRLGMAYRPLIILLTTILLFIIGYTSVKPKTYDIRANEVADVTIRAPYTTIDTQRTAENKQLAMDSVADIYSFQESIREDQLSLVEQYFSGIRQLKKETYSTVLLKEWVVGLENEATLSTQIGQSERTETQEVQFAQLNEAEKIIVFYHQIQNSTKEIQTFATNLSDDIHLTLLTASDNEIVAIQREITNIVAERLATDIAAERVSDTVETIRQELRRTINDSQRLSVLEALAVQLVVPTVVYDQKATELARENAANQVQSTYILQGQVIVQEGFVATAEMMRVLNIYGILDTEAPSYTVYAFLAVLLIHAILLLIVFSRWDNKQHKTVKDGNMRLTAYVLVILFSFVALVVLQIIEINGLKHALLMFPAGLIPILIWPKTDRRTGLLAIVFFNLIALFILNYQTDAVKPSLLIDFQQKRVDV